MNLKQKRAINQLKELEKRIGKNMRLAAEEWNSEWKTLISIIMSAQSRDETTIPIAEKLFNGYSDLEKLANAKYNEVLNVFKSLNYNKTKAKNVIGAAKFILDKYNGNIPKKIDKLIEIPGVGRKTANVFLSEYGGKGIGVDTHVFYISRKLGWAKSKYPNKVELELIKLFPKRYWNMVNPILVRFGKNYTGRREKDKLLDEISKIK